MVIACVPRLLRGARVVRDSETKSNYTRMCLCACVCCARVCFRVIIPCVHVHDDDDDNDDGGDDDNDNSAAPPPPLEVHI